jgi:PAS domain S-box-containing protein
LSERVSLAAVPDRMAVPPLSPLPPEDPARLQARLRGLLEVALDCIITIDHDGRIIDFNPAAERTFGYEKSEALGQEMAELIVPPALRERHRTGLARAARGEAPQMLGRRIEITALRRDGTEFPVELAITKVPLGPDEPPVYTAHLRDISDRKQTETALLSLQEQLEERIAERTSALRASEANLRRSQELFVKSFHVSPALMTIAQLPEGRLIEVNTAFQQAVGRPKRELIGRTTIELGLWHEPEQRNVFLTRFQEQKSVRDFEADFNSVTGRRTLLLNAEQIDVGGAPAILTVAVDISERRRREEAEAALARAEESYRSIFENALEGLYQSTPNGRFLRVNPALARMFGYETPMELITEINDIGRRVYVKPGRREEFFALLGEQDHVTDFESEIYRRDGSRLWISESVRAVRSDTGVLLYLEGIAIDITAQREAARALAEAKEAADAANRAKSQFLASMSHELRTPLNGILGYTQILSRDNTLGPGQHRGIQVIHQSAEHLLGLINDVLDLSKVEAGRLELHPTACDLPALLSGVAELLGPRANAQGLGFATAFAPDLPRSVTVDASRLRQVLLNLLSNALKFTREGSVLFSAQPTRCDTPDAVKVTFSVSDTGSGISAEDLPRLFQPFAQLGERKRATEGTGLGLAISRSLVAALGGQLQVESRLGWGSRFWFELTLPKAGTGTSAPLPRHRRITGYEGARRRILVVDDHPANREVLELLLRSIGFEVVLADSGEVAIEACANTQPNAVLMDLRMDGMSGLEAARWLRQQYGTALPIIAVSASAYDLDRQACLDAGCDDFLAKPVDAEALWQSLGRVLPLEWTYEEVQASRPTVAPFASVKEAPPADAVKAIHDLARAGDVVGLRNRAETLAREHPRHAEFARAVLDLAGNFKMKAIRQLVAPWMDDPKKT